MKLLKLIPLLLAIGVAAPGCVKDKSEPEPNPIKPTPYRVRMTDAPGPYTAVNVDIQSVIVTGNGANVTLNTTPGIYNLLDFTNGADTLIATGSLTLSKVQQIRLVLGPNNSVVVGGTTYPLATPSAQQSGLKLQVHQTLEAGVAYEVLLDFDANSSIVVEGNGSYSLKPVIRTIENAISGSLKGTITPTGVVTSVTASDGTTSYATTSSLSGGFMLAGLPAGTYTVTITPPAPYNQVVIPNVVITTGQVTDVGTQSI